MEGNNCHSFTIVKASKKNLLFLWLHAPASPHIMNLLFIMASFWIVIRFVRTANTKYCQITRTTYCTIVQYVVRVIWQYFVLAVRTNLITIQKEAIMNRRFIIWGEAGACSQRKRRFFFDALTIVKLWQLFPSIHAVIPTVVVPEYIPP